MSSKEKILKIKRDVLKIVEALLEKNISKEYLLEKCNKLCQADYNDVVQERSIDLLCGYPMCDKPIKQMTKQKYHISRAENKIYDITERKKFCSNECYKASTFLKEQLESLPLYMRKSEASSSKLKLLSDSDNKGSAGEELVFKHNMSKKDIEETCMEPLVSSNLNSMLQEDIKDCTEHLTNLEIKENVFENKYVFREENSYMLSCDTFSANASESSDSDSSESSNKTLFPAYDNVDALSNKHISVPQKAKKIVLIDPLNTTKISVSSTAKLPVGFLAKVFQDWFTVDTMKFLLGEKQVFSIKADHLFKKMVNSEEPHDKLSSIKDEYINLCMKIDRLSGQDDKESDSTEIDICEKKPVQKCETNHNLQKIISEMNSLPISSKPNPIRRTKKKTQSKKKSVSFKSDSITGKNKSTNNNLSEDTNAKPLPEPLVPSVKSLSQNTLRRQVLMNKLKNVYINLLPVIDKHYKDIREEITVIVNTFSLAPTNILYKPKQFNCIATVLYRILTYTKLQELHNDSEFSKLCENSLASQNISKGEVENLVLDLISPNQVLKLQ